MCQVSLIKGRDYVIVDGINVSSIINKGEIIAIAASIKVSSIINKGGR